MTSDERLASMLYFSGESVVVTEKMDGENSCILPGGRYHARSPDSGPAPWRTHLAALAYRVGKELPDGWMLFGENVYAKHSIAYDDLLAYFLGFSIWDREWCYSWDDTMEWFSLLDVVNVPIIYEGIYNRATIEWVFENYSKSRGREVEGYVVRCRRGFLSASFKENVAKYVRAGHVQTDERWERSWAPNKLLKDRNGTNAE